MRVERTEDESLIRSVFEHPEIKPQIWGEGEVLVPINPAVYYLAIYDEELVGLVVFVPLNPAAWGPHMAVLPKHRGKGTEAFRIALEWMFSNTPCRKVFADPPVFNRAVIRVFQKCGLAIEGRSLASFPWHGEMHDRLLLGTEK